VVDLPIDALLVGAEYDRVMIASFAVLFPERLSMAG